jgi:hypothetical protein
MIYRGPGFLAVVGFGSSTPPSPLLLSVISTGDTNIVRLRKRDNLLTGGEQGMDEEPKPNHRNRKKAWFSVHHSILSVGLFFLDVGGWK